MKIVVLGHEIYSVVCLGKIIELEKLFIVYRMLFFDS